MGTEEKEEEKVVEEEVEEEEEEEGHSSCYQVQCNAMLIPFALNQNCESQKANKDGK